jgi:hypothetical protein
MAVGCFAGFSPLPAVLKKLHSNFLINSSQIQCRYAVMKHPYYRYGYAAAILFGVIGYGIATSEKKAEKQDAQHPK